MPMESTCIRTGCDCQASGPWRAEYLAYIGNATLPDGRWGEKILRWRSYNRPHYHIHHGGRYTLECLAHNLKLANVDQDHLARGFTLRMRNVATNDIIMADIL